MNNVRSIDFVSQLDLSSHPSSYIELCVDLKDCLSLDFLICKVEVTMALNS